jgi:zinc-ribbon domain
MLMQCPACGTDVRAGQKFCMECGQSLRGVSDVTGEVPTVTATSSAAETSELPPIPSTAGTTPDNTREMASVPAPPARSWSAAGPSTGDTSPTGVLPTAPPPPPPPPGVTGEYAAPEQPTWYGVQAKPPRPGFRLRPLLLLALIAAGAAVVGVMSTVIEITTTVDSAPFDIGIWKVNDFGTNNTMAALIAAGTMVGGALAWCFGFRWGAGLAGGAGAALAGWAAVLIGLAELPISNAEAAAALAPADITRDIGYWAVVGAGAVGGLVLIVSFARAGNDGRAGLDPWIAALAAVSALVAAIGPTIPEGSASWSGNYSSAGFAVDLPTAFFAGRMVQLGLLAFCGVVGFLLVRRYGLGLAVGGAVAAGWMVVTAATERTESPIGPAFRNPPYGELKPHAVTVVGMALLGFFALVAIVMALLDADR